MGEQQEIIQHEYTTLEEGLPFERRADLIFADPPYNIGVKYDDDPTNDKMDPELYFQWVQNVLVNLKKSCLRPGGTLWWVCPEEHADTLGPLLTNYIGPRLYRIVWHETFSQYNRHDLTQDYRFIFCHVCGDDERKVTKIPASIPFHMVKKGSPYDLVTMNLDDIRVPSRRMELGDKRAAGPRIPGRVWKLRRLQGTAKDRVNWHPAQMPPEVLERIVKGWTDPGDIVLDAFAGSGSMGIACQRLGRKFIGIERSQKYCCRMRARLGIKEPE